MKFLVIGIFLTTATISNAQKFTPPDVIDQRVELISIVYRLSGAEEYTNINYPDLVFEQYIDSIEVYFRKYEKHPAVQFARKLKKRGIGYNYVMYLPLVVTNPPNMEITVPFMKGKPTSRWDLTTALEFVDLLNQFYHDTNFEQFMVKNKPLYDAVEIRFSEMTARIDTAWYAKFYGYRSDVDFNAINALSIGPHNYNVDVDHPDGRKSTFAILGSSVMDSMGMPVYNQRYLNVLLHEFNHSFANPIILENEKEFKNAGKGIYNHFKRNKISTNVAYGNWQSVLCESLVRAAVIKYLMEHGYDNLIIDSQVELEKERGFHWVQDLLERFDYYSANRKEYKDLVDYMPELRSFFEGVEENIRMNY
jgi:hypothetical protein